MRIGKWIGVCLVLVCLLLKPSPAAAQFAIQIDARALTAQDLTVVGIVNFTNGSVFTANLSPGVYQVAHFGGAVSFSVTSTGTVDFAPELNSILAGRGTSKLVVYGATIGIDARPLTAKDLTLAGVVQFTNGSILAVHVLPGSERLVEFGGDVFFSVTPAGTVDYDPSMNTILSGRGTSTVVVNGLSIGIDARALTAQDLTLAGIVQFTNGGILTVRVLPGTGRLVEFGGDVFFTVTPAGTIDYDHSVDAILSGRGTSTVVVNGLNIGIDARALPPQELKLAGIANITNGSVFTATLLSGSGRLVYFNGVSLADLYFAVTLAGTVDYDHSLDPILAGRGTSTLFFRDTLAPTWTSGTLTASNLGLTSLTLSWTAAADNVGVTAYRLYRNGTQMATVAGTAGTTNVTGLTANTAYTFKVKAGDAAGNWSTNGPSVTVRTPTPQQATQLHITQVSALVAAGVISQGQGTALTHTLQAALQQLNAGNTTAANQLLQAFRDQVNALVTSGALSAAQGQALIGPA